MRVTLCPSVRFSSTDTVNRAGNRHDRASIFCLVNSTRFLSFVAAPNKQIPDRNRNSSRVCRSCGNYPSRERFSLLSFCSRCCALRKVNELLQGIHRVSFCILLFHSVPLPCHCNERTRAKRRMRANYSIARCSFARPFRSFRILPKRSYRERTFRVVGRP